MVQTRSVGPHTPTTNAVFFVSRLKNNADLPYRGCKPEPPKILPENTVGAVSGLLYNPTLFSAHISPGFDRYYQPMVTCDGKQVFGVTPHQC